MSYKKIFKKLQKPLVSCSVIRWRDIILKAVFDYCLKKGIGDKESKVNLLEQGWCTVNGKTVFAYVWIYPDNKIRHLLRVKIKPRFLKSGMKTKTRIVVSIRWSGLNALEQYKELLSFSEIE